jgi:hypothetical protein
MGKALMLVDVYPIFTSCRGSAARLRPSEHVKASVAEIQMIVVFISL